MRVLSQETGGAGGAIPEMETWGELRFGGVRFEELTGHPGRASHEELAGATHLFTRHTRGEDGGKSQPEAESQGKQPHGKGQAGSKEDHPGRCRSARGQVVYK